MRVQLQDETNDAEREAQREAGLKRLRECYEAHDEEGIARESQRYYAEWEEFGRKRLMMAEFHLEQLKRLVLPTQVTKMCERVLTAHTTLRRGELGSSGLEGVCCLRDTRRL